LSLELAIHGFAASSPEKEREVERERERERDIAAPDELGKNVH
jgi:hypothetical protein